MNAIVQYQPQTPALISSLADVERVATSMAQSGAFGVKDPHTALILCLLAHEEGRSPVAAARDYHVIQGTPAKKADAMLRDFIASGGRVEWHRIDDECADATFTHPSGGSARISWDKARVVQAQLSGNPMHKKYPRQMLRSRVVSEGVRTVFPGATSGMYVPEEVVDFDNAPSKPTPQIPQAKRARDLPAVEHKQDPEHPAEDEAARTDAVRWVERYEGQVRDAQSMAELESVDSKASRALSRLAKAFPDLHERAINFRNGTTPAADLLEVAQDDDDTDRGGGFGDGE